MKGPKRYLVFIGIGLTLFSCKKEHLQPNNGIAGTPVFYFNGNVNSAPVSLQAGVNNYYMYSSYTQDANNVYNFTGTLQQIGCTTCSNSIKIIINDFRSTASGGNESLIDSSFTSSSYAFKTPTGGAPTAYSVTFSPTIGYGTPLNCIWNFGDGLTYSGSFGAQTHKYKHPGNYNVSLAVNFTSGTDTLQTTVQPNTPAAPWATILECKKDDSTAGKLTLLDSLTPATSPLSVSWNFGDGNNYNNPSISLDTVTHKYSKNGVYLVTSIVTDSGGNTHTDACKFVAKYSSFTPVYIKTLNPSAGTPVANPLSLSNTTIVYTDASGDVYSSANVAQPVSSYFTILSVSNYQNNENNQTTKQLHVQFNCTLMDGSGKTIPVTNGDAVIAVAYK
jgi:PKD repeat protein